MISRSIIAPTLMALCLMGMSAYVSATDLDDNIGLDEPLTDRLEPFVNIQFITTKAVVKAKARAKRGQKDLGIDNAGIGNINIGPGAKLKGVTIVNISKVKNGTVISK